MEQQGLVPLFYHPDVEIGKQVLKACYEGGSRLLEFTNRGIFAHEVFTELSKYVNTHLPGMMLGVGSVTDAATASLFMQCGQLELDLWVFPGTLVFSNFAYFLVMVYIGIAENSKF